MIIIKKLTKKYGKVVAVDELDLTIPKGQLFGFLGPNGAGKTTTIKILAGLLHSTHGSVTIGGFDVRQQQNIVKKITGYIPDKPFLYEKLTGQEFLEFTARLYEIDLTQARRRIKEYLELFRLTAWADELIEGYSHGMKQKIVMSAAFLHCPQVIIVDEPMVGLDPEGALQVKKIFKNLVKDGTTIFMSTHTLTIAQQLCDRIAIIQKGKIIADGSVDDLRTLVQSGSAELEDIFLELTSDQHHQRIPDIPV